MANNQGEISPENPWNNVLGLTRVFYSEGKASPEF
jgi:hypothetical protein